jgi:hypothetical protein
LTLDARNPEAVAFFRRSSADLAHVLIHCPSDRDFALDVYGTLSLEIRRQIEQELEKEIRDGNPMIRREATKVLALLKKAM